MKKSRSRDKEEDFKKEQKKQPATKHQMPKQKKKEILCNYCRGKKSSSWSL